MSFNNDMVAATCYALTHGQEKGQEGGWHADPDAVRTLPAAQASNFQEIHARGGRVHRRIQER
jgi:hypothetical protein